MNIKSLNEMVAYQKWATQQVLNAVSTLSDEQLMQKQDYSVGGIYEQLTHVLWSDWWLLHTLQGTMPERDDPTYLTKAQLPDLDTIKKRWHQFDDELDAYVATLNDDKLQTDFVLQMPDGSMKNVKFYEMFTAMFNHGTNHRAQIFAIMHMLGATSDAEQGYYFYMAQRN